MEVYTQTYKLMLLFYEELWSMAFQLISPVIYSKTDKDALEKEAINCVGLHFKSHPLTYLYLLKRIV